MTPRIWPTPCVPSPTSWADTLDARIDVAGGAERQQMMARPDQVRVPGGTFSMGSDRHYPEEGPAREKSVDGFWMDRCPVTNEQFGAFVEDTGYRTVAERPLDPSQFPGAPAENLVPGSLVFSPTPGPVDLRHLDQWWTWTPGASWRRPFGPRSGAPPRPRDPVVHVAFEDAASYAEWAGAALPTEAEWERAARGGLDGATYVWGDEPERSGERLANYWHGDFPWRARRGYGTVTPVGSFPANGYGLHDMAGNVWEWTTDLWSSGRPAGAGCCASEEGSYDPSQPQFRIPRKVVKGGSFLCADEYCLRYRPAARRPQMIDTGMSHIGFRCVVREER
jgi:formylglycine-generating enzyme required for sulfatase activity